jgi:hypothetical protein
MRYLTARRRAAAGLLLLGMTGAAQGADRSEYSLFYPTPDKYLREMNTDRPDTTESPFTVDAGRIQVETNLMGFTRSRPNPAGAVTDSYDFATTNIRIGLTTDTELSLVWQPFGIVQTHQVNPVGSFRQSGIGGVDLRLKFNIWGNDTFEKAGTALALLPYVTLPTDRHDGISPEFVESGLIVPFAIKLSDKFDLGLNAGVAYIKDDATTDYHAEYIASASLSYDWNEKFGTYYEVAARFHTADPRGDVVVLGTGLTYKFSRSIQFDTGVNFGIIPAADRINPFAGISTRF